MYCLHLSDEEIDHLRQAIISLLSVYNVPVEQERALNEILDKLGQLRPFIKP